MSKTNKTSFYLSNYECEKIDYCTKHQGCFWYNGEQCIRQLLTEEDVEEITKQNKEV